jgi:hypothetical protein
MYVNLILLTWYKKKVEKKMFNSPLLSIKQVRNSWQGVNG